MTRPGVRWLFSITGLLIAALISSSAFGRYHWLLDIFSHFQLQYALLLGFCLIVLIVVRANRLLMLVMAAALAFNLYLLVPFFVPNQVQADELDLRLLAFNVYTANQREEVIAHYLRQTDPDVIMLSEITPDMLLALSNRLNGTYPYIFDASTRGTMGLAFMSKVPLEEPQEVIISSSSRRQRRVIETDLTWQGRPVRLYGVHPLPPLGKRWAQSRNLELGRIAELVAESNAPTVVMGDFNASPWSHAMTALTHRADLRYASKGFGIWPTWRYGSLLLGAPIDHILLSKDWQVSSYRVGGNLGSDHFPVLADLRLHGL